MNLPSYATISAILVVGLGGFMIGRITNASSPGTEASDKSPTLAGKSALRAASADRAGAPGRSVRAASGISARIDDPDLRHRKLEEIIRGEDALARNRQLLGWIDQLAPGEFEAAVAHFRSLGITESRFGEYATLLSAWAKVDPLAALEYTRANTRGGFATETVLAAWATHDSFAAVQYAEANHEGSGANPLLVGVIRGIAGSDPTLATQLLTGMPRSEERAEALDAMMPYLLSQGPAATKAWIESLTDESLKSGAMLRSAEQLAENDPRGTMDWLLENPSEATRRRMDDVFNVWMQKDRDAALAAMASLPAGENRSNALRGVMSSVAAEDPNEALSLMDRFPSDVTDRVVQNFVWHTFRDQPEMAINQVSKVGSERAREWMYRRLLDNWMDRDQAAAAAWVQQNPLPQGVVDHLNRRQQSNNGG